MRFEIKPRGGFVILVGLLALCATVFFLGIVSGREMVRSERDQNQLVSVYPIPTSGPASPLQAAKSPAAGAAATLKPSSLTPVASENTPPAATPKPSLEHAALPHPSSTNASINRSIRTSHLGYKIMIEATMDHEAADRMTTRLLGLGYTSRIVPIQINGQTWYGMQVGPYPTEDAALAAEANLRAAYAARYINKTGVASTETTGAAGTADTNSDGAAAQK
jgi:cell division protein FtsN